MTKLKKSDVEHVAKLAKLDLSEEEKKKFTAQLSKILEYMDVINEVDTKNVEPTSQTTGLTNVVRDDKIDTTRILGQDEALSGIDNTYNGYFKVSAVLEK